MPRFAWIPDDLYDGESCGEEFAPAKAPSAARRFALPQPQPEPPPEVPGPTAGASVAVALAATPVQAANSHLLLRGCSRWTTLPPGPLQPSQIPRPQRAPAQRPPRDLFTVPLEAASQLANSVCLVSKLHLSAKVLLSELEARESEVRQLRKALSDFTGVVAANGAAAHANGAYVSNCCGAASLAASRNASCECERRFSGASGGGSGGAAALRVASQHGGASPNGGSTSRGNGHCHGAAAAAAAAEALSRAGVVAREGDERLRGELGNAEARERDLRAEWQVEREGRADAERGAAEAAALSRALQDEVIRLREKEGRLAEHIGALKKASVSSNFKRREAERDLERCRMSAEDMRFARAVAAAAFSAAAAAASAAAESSPLSRGDRSLALAFPNAALSPGGHPRLDLLGWSGRTRGARIGPPSPRASLSPSFFATATADATGAETPQATLATPGLATPTRSERGRARGRKTPPMASAVISQAAEALLLQMFSGEAPRSPGAASSRSSKATTPGGGSRGGRSGRASEADHHSYTLSPSRSPAASPPAPPPPVLAAPTLAPSASGGGDSAGATARAERPKEASPMLLALNGRMPSFPAAELGEREPGATRRRSCPLLQSQTTSPSPRSLLEVSAVEADSLLSATSPPRVSRANGASSSPPPPNGDAAHPLAADHDGREEAMLRGRLSGMSIAGAVARAMGSPEPWVPARGAGSLAAAPPSPPSGIWNCTRLGHPGSRGSAGGASGALSPKSPSGAGERPPRSPHAAYRPPRGDRSPASSPPSRAGAAAPVRTPPQTPPSGTAHMYRGQADAPRNEPGIGALPRTWLTAATAAAGGFPP